MPRYFFNTRDGESWIRDEAGLELSGIEEARLEATAGLADMARDALPGASRKELSVEVLDAEGRALFRAVLRLEVEEGGRPRSPATVSANPLS
jgi:hypothetical protein